MKFLVLLKNDLRNLIKEPSNTIILFLFPLVMILLFGFLFRDNYTSDLLNAYDYYGVTFIFFIATMAATIPANVFLEAKIKNGNTRIFNAPISVRTIYLAKIVASFMFIGFILVMLVLVLSLSSLVNLGNHLLLIIILLLAFVFMLVTMSSAICVSVKSEEITNTIISNSTMVFSLFSGVFFPIASLGEWAESFSNISPLKWVINTSFEIIYDGYSSNFIFIVAALIIVGLLFMLIVEKNYKPQDYL